MIKFQKGDRVECTEKASFMKVGETGVVDEDNTDCPFVFIDGKGREPVRASRLKLITPQYTKLNPKVGDKFRVVKKPIVYSGKVSVTLNVGETVTFEGETSTGNLDFGKADLDPNRLTTEYLEPVEEDCDNCGGSKECQHASHFTDCNSSCDCDGTCTHCDEAQPFQFIQSKALEKYTQQWMKEAIEQTEYKPFFNIMGNWDYSEEPTLITKTMNRIKKALLSKADKTLIEAGYLDSNLDLTSDGKNALQFIEFEANKKALVEMAQADIDEADSF